MVRKLLLAATALSLVAGQAGAQELFPLQQIPGGSGGGPLALTRTFNQPAGTSTPAEAFKVIGQPFTKGVSVPPGYVLSATLGGHPVRVAACQRKAEADGSLAWSQLIVDYSGQTIPPGSSSTLQLTAVPGAWNDTNPDTDAALEAQWTGQNFTATAATVSTTSTGGSDMNAGPYTAAFNGAAKVTVMCTSPLGREYQVVAPYVNASSVMHRFLQAVAYFLVTTNADGTFGPVLYLGPASENWQVFKTNPGEFTYDLTFAQNGTTIRSYPGVVSPGQTSMWAGRPDGDWAYTADDPQIWVDQDYSQVAATGKVPNYKAGLSYVGGGLSNVTSEPITAESGGAFTVPSIAGLMQQSDSSTFQAPTSVEVDGSLGGLSGMSLEQVYWFRYGGSTSFTLYDTQAHAWAGGATGKIVPTGTYSGSGMTVQLDAGPNSPGLLDLSTSDTGSRPELGVIPETSVAYLVGHSQAFQRQGRVNALALLSIPIFAEDDTTGTIPSLLDSGDTPTTQPNMAGGTGLGTAKPNTYYANLSQFSSDIGGGSGPTGTSGDGTLLTDPQGLWTGASEFREHIASDGGYLVWLLEGNPYLQRLGVFLGNQGVAQQVPSSRNFSCPAVASGATFYGVSASLNLDDRQMAWSELMRGQAAFMAAPGSAEEKYFQNGMNNEGNWELAYQSYKGANFTALGLTGIDENGTCAATLQGPYGSNFQAVYTNLGFGLAANLEGDFAPAFKTVADRTAGLLVDELSTNIPFFADNYNPGVSLSDAGATSPGSYVASAADLGVGEEWKFSFSGSTVTVSNYTSATPGWGTQYSSVTLPFAQGDKYRCFTYNSDGQGPTAPCPTPLTPGTDYYVCSPSGAAFNLSANASCTPLFSFSTASNIGGIMLPSGQTAPPASDGTMHSNIASPDSYLNNEKSAVCFQASRGVAGAAAACANAAAVTTANYSTEAMWAIVQ